MKKLFTKKMKTEELDSKDISSNINVKEISTKKSRFKGKLKRIKKRWIIIAIIVIAIGAFFIIQGKNKNTMIGEIKYTTLSKGTITNSINVSGIIKSDKSTNVYTTLTSPVKEIKVKVGDKVKAGDVLAFLDKTNLEKDVEQAAETINADEANNKITLDNAKKAYDNALYLDKNNLNTELTSAEAAVKTTAASRDSLEKTYEYNKALYQYGEVSEQDLKKAQTDFENAKIDYNKAVIALENAKVKAVADLNTAKNAYQTALTNYNNKSQRIGFESKKKQLEDCVIKAPVSGTITASTAVVGSPSNGPLFEIEDLDNKTITVSIKEVDVANVKVGQKAEIKTDATGDTKIEGQVMSIEPTAKKNEISQGQGQSSGGSASGDVQFEAKIKMNASNENIKVGMKARVSIVVEQKSDIYTVPYESIVQNGDDTSIYVAEKKVNENEKYIVKQISVKTGMESDVNVEVSGKGVTDNIIVLSDPGMYPVGSEIQLSKR